MKELGCGIVPGSGGMSPLRLGITSSERLFLIFIIVSSLLLPYPLLSFDPSFFYISFLFHSFPIRASECWFSAGAEGMSLHIYIAHTGEHFLADPVSFASYVHPIYPIAI